MGRSPGPERRIAARESLAGGTLARGPMAPPGPLGVKGGTAKEAGPAPPPPSPPVTIVFVTQGDTRPPPDSLQGQFVNYDDIHYAQAAARYGPTDHIYQVDSDDHARWQLDQLYSQGVRASRVVFFGHGDDSGFFFSVLVRGDQITVNDEPRRVFDRGDTALAEALARILDVTASEALVRFDACQVGQNAQLMDTIRQAVESTPSESGHQRVRISAPRDPYNLQSIVDERGQVVGWREPPAGPLGTRTVPVDR